MPLAGLLMTQNNEVSAPPRCDQDLPSTDGSRRSPGGCPGYGELAELFFAGPIKSGSNENRLGRPKKNFTIFWKAKAAAMLRCSKSPLDRKGTVGTRAAGRLPHTRERE
jgi:hypothetical protein